MALFAKIGLNNVVENVVVVNNLETMTEEGVLDETIGQTKLQGETGHSSWLLCSDVSGNASRKNIPSIGCVYSSANDGFYEPRPNDRNGVACTSWTLNSTTCKWDAPITQPLSYWTIGYESAGIASTATTSAGGGHQNMWLWDEVQYDADSSDPKTVGWFEQT
mgnify:CR=1 FL=1